MKFINSFDSLTLVSCDSSLHWKMCNAKSFMADILANLCQNQYRLLPQGSEDCGPHNLQNNMGSGNGLMLLSHTPLFELKVN